MTQQIAQLNGQIGILENAGQSAGTFLDQRIQLIKQLSSLIDVSVIPSDNTITLTTTSGTALVAGQQSFSLSAAPDSSGATHVFSQGKDITSTIVSGQLGGLLAVRDQQIPAIQSQLDNLAASLADSVNSVQTSGYDLNGNATSGVSLFSVPTSLTGAAANVSIAITEPSLLAASSDGTAGSNGNAEAMYALRNQGIISGESASDYYSRIVFNVGNAVGNATAQQNASDLVLQQLNNQRSSISGVSLDEEAANLIQYQQAYAASAKVVSTINSMMETVIAMKS